METNEDPKCVIPLVHYTKKKRKAKKRLKIPLRVLRLCLLGILLPGCLIAGPLYLRYHVYREQVYPVGMSDMRLVDNKISTTWCQKQMVRSNATFNAYLLPEQPKLTPEPARVSMVRKIYLEDDMKEYWGFYLLKGSIVTVSTCCRWAGASLIIIRGHDHLRECAYIGDDSSEELEELNRHPQTETQDVVDDAESNKPHKMKRLRPGVVITGQQHDSHQQLSHEREHHVDNELFLYNTLIKPFKYAQRRKANDSSERRKHEKKLESDVRLRKIVETENIEINTVVEKDPVESMTTSEEIYREVLYKLKGLGTRGSKLLEKLNGVMNNETVSLSNRVNVSDVLLTENLTQERSVGKRDIRISSVLSEELSKHDEENDLALEDGLNPDGIADHRGTVNETTLNDGSHSEYWSSFSSSEERLINCDGLILNLPLTPRTTCTEHHTDHDHAEASLANSLTYKVPSNGYYFFVFSSENEVQTNFIRIQFHLEKTLYNVSNPVAECNNSTEQCELPLRFFSREKTVFELPVSQNDSMWNQEYVVVTTCEPRTSVYVACVVAVPILFLLFAF